MLKAAVWYTLTLILTLYHCCIIYDQGFEKNDCLETVCMTFIHDHSTLQPICYATNTVDMSYIRVEVRRLVSIQCSWIFSFKLATKCLFTIIEIGRSSECSSHVIWNQSHHPAISSCRGCSRIVSTAGFNADMSSLCSSLSARFCICRFRLSFKFT
jgi:hypothetical protein